MDKVFMRNTHRPAKCKLELFSDYKSILSDMNTNSWISNCSHITVSKTKRAGITFPVTRVYRQLRRKRCANKIRMLSAVYTAVVLEYLVAEILEIAGIEAKQLNRKRIIPRHIMLGIKKDDELNRLLKGAVLSFCGVVPNVQAALLVKKK